MYHLMRRPHHHGPFREFRRLLESPFFSDFVDFFERPFPATDVKDLGESIEVTMDLPGVNKEDISIEYNNNVLTISGRSSVENKYEQDNFFRQERYYGSFNRQIALPAAVDYTQAKASFQNGVLKITLPKTNAGGSNRIPIE
ncbi:MAG: Hsp20/alpha crystallin family protein [Firmicutes bacterium]|nr:Hsp20/alpha crystallin family protein [Bacillota bacterium]